MPSMRFSAAQAPSSCCPVLLSILPPSTASATLKPRGELLESTSTASPGGDAPEPGGVLNCVAAGGGADAATARVSAATSTDASRGLVIVCPRERSRAGDLDPDLLPFLPQRHFLVSVVTHAD